MKSASFPAFSLMRIGRIASLSAMPLLFAACTAMGPVPSHYPDADLAVAPQAMAQAQSSDLAYDLVASLTTEVGPRSAGSPGEAAAVAWAKAKLTALGFDRVWTEPVHINAWSLAGARAESDAPYPQPLTLACLRSSVSKPTAGISS